MRFQHYIGIDYSGAATPSKRTGAIQVYHAAGDAKPIHIACPASGRSKRNWNRIELYQWLNQFLESHQATMVAIDHGFSFPASYFQQYRLKNWDEFLVDFIANWPTDSPDATVEEFRANTQRSGSAKELRLTERWTSSAKSVFQFDVQGSVAKSTHAGLPFLHQLRQSHPSLHFWPFDGYKIGEQVENEGSQDAAERAGRSIKNESRSSKHSSETHRPTNSTSVVAEVYPSIFRNRYPRSNRTVDQQDAYAICRWLSETDLEFDLDPYLQPPLTETEQATVLMEGWILGVI
ncbi:MAG: hypothetical protein AAFN77_22520 [Planctomycetota bacterium]